MGFIISFWHAKNKIHCLVWILYMLYETLIVGILLGSFGNPIIYLAHYLIVILFFYLHANEGLPFAMKAKQNAVFLIPIVVAIELSIYTLAQYAVTLLLAKIDLNTASGKEFNNTFILRNVYRGILFLGFSTGYYYLKTYLTERKKTAQLEKERLEAIIAQQQMAQELITAQNAFLKAQINPHFLFNSLDFIYHKVNKHSEVAGEAVVKLADMMRFAVTANEMGDTIYISEEIAQVENLLYLYQIRKHHELNVHFSYSDAVKHLRFIPLVILTLVENIFKHGDISNEDEIAVIKLEVADDQFVIQTMNLIKTTNVKNSTRAGLNNIKKRLSFAYGENLGCDFQAAGNHFKVKIVIPLTLLTTPVSSVNNATNNGK